MVKVWGSIFTIAGSLVLLYCWFLYMNTSSYLAYNQKTHVSLLDVNLLLPVVFGALAFLIGVVLLSTSKDKNYAEHH